MPFATVMPQTVLWAWEEPEGLRSAPESVGVAYLAETLFLGKPAPAVPAITVIKRHQPLAVAPQASVMAVVRVVALPGFQDSPTIREQTAAALAEVPHRPGLRALQIDFDATRSQRAFYAAVLSLLRPHMPAAMPLSMTALLSWCAAGPGSFTEKLFLKGIALVQITRALHLGCAAKYISLLNEPGGELISRLSYFGDLIEQIVGPTLEPQNWALIEVIMAKYELGWCVTYLASAVSTFKLTCREAEQILKLSIDRVRALSNERKLRELTEDQALRLSCITRTFCAAERSRGLMAPHWFTTPNSDQVFAGQRPIDRMSTDDLEELETICRRVRSLAGY